MIWFACKQCGKTHGRPDSSAGSLLFCECGQGNTVPWESTAAEPPPSAPSAPVVVADVPRAPLLEPLTFETTRSPTTGPPIPLEPDVAPRRRGRAERRDPDYCFNHQDLPKKEVCEDCGEAFCAACVVKFQGAALCGPCKNFRVRSLEAPPATSSLASASVLISILTGLPLVFCLLPFGQTVLSILALVPQLLALGLGVRAMMLAEREGKFGSQAWAVTGIAASSLTCFLTILLNIYASRLSV